MTRSRTAAKAPAAKAAARFESVDQYLALLAPAARKVAQQMRKTIKKQAPGAEEVISYNMPGYKLNGLLIWFAVWKEHIGLYPTPNAIEFFKKELAGYACSKGAIQFPLDQPLPLELIARIVAFRVEELQNKKKR
ncbi:MAG: DUF1801 domain-containing protein [Candidatus Pseudobacter hemicellulosilyticus]|uniref:DUF1801 domain-containing protein n=1 Tax=Candidatus Pseudobacter hemicellulosilyticus TaxID=3121375 RepID=A0AAJ5WVD5_9BACT|nr:MAG: DUF1801 domain-containing protein [Pseudobacter sp.]